jgi:predicted DNA-binding transcriptional regulator AlpA
MVTHGSRSVEMYQDKIVREPERKEITGLSRVSWWRLERNGMVPKRIKLSSNTVGWRLSELMEWVRSRQHK